jgi:hypothetical protein
MARTSTASSTEVLAGLVDRVTFHNPENGLCVLRVKARGQRDLITVLGHAAMFSAGEFVQASGIWVNDRAWRPIQSLVPEGLGTDDGRRDREVSRLRHASRHWAGLCEEARERLR